MINLRITGLYNRGQQDEYVELEAAARCDLEGLMLVRYLYNAEGFPIYSQARLYEFPDTCHLPEPLSKAMCRCMMKP